jgi:hypothetical protein
MSASQGLNHAPAANTLTPTERQTRYGDGEALGSASFRRWGYDEKFAATLLISACHSYRSWQ